jgi:superfamily II DNA or RNA helicase
MVMLRLLGRALALKPGAYGELFHKLCTVTRTTTERSWSGGRVVEKTVSDDLKLYWYDTHQEDGEKVFCTYSGYASVIKKELENRGLSVEVDVKTADGLEKPDFSVTQGIDWRNRQKEVMVKLLANTGGVIVCPTGFGKTFLIKILARMYKTAKIVFTVTTTDVARRVYADLKSELGDDVGFVGDGHYKLRRIIVCVAKSLHKCPKEVNLVLCDECHELLTVNYIKMLSQFMRARMFGFTASPVGRTDGTDALAHAIFGPVLIDVSYAEGVAGGNILPISVRMYQVTTGPDINNIKDSNTALRYGVWRNQSRNQLIADVTNQTRQEVGEDAQILIMVDKIEHAFLLGQLLPDFMVVTGDMDKARYWKLRNQGVILEGQRTCSKDWRAHCLREFEANRMKRVIATMVWKQGVDFRDLAVLVRADGLASKINAIQIPGRLSRLGKETVKTRGILVDFFDEFSKRLKARSYSRLRVYKSSGWDIEHRTGI